MIDMSIKTRLILKWINKIPRQELILVKVNVVALVNKT